LAAEKEEKEKMELKIREMEERLRKEEVVVSLNKN
jgi:hypothetical protein